MDDFKLPSKWCVFCPDGLGHATSLSEILQWRSANESFLYVFHGDGYIKNSKLWAAQKPDNHTLITYEEFLQYVYHPWYTKKFGKSPYLNSDAKVNSTAMKLLLMS